MRYVEAHPDAGATEVARACDQPRSRVRPWLTGAKPDPVRAIEVAAERNWLDA